MKKLVFGPPPALTADERQIVEAWQIDGAAVARGVNEWLSHLAEQAGRVGQDFSLLRRKIETTIRNAGERRICAQAMIEELRKLFREFKLLG